MYCVTMHAPTGRKPRGAVAMVFLRNYTQYTRRYANRATLTQLGLAVYKPSQSLGGKHLCCVFQNSKNHEGRRMKIYKCFKNTTYELCNNNLIWIVNNHGATTSSKFIKVWKPVNLTEAFLQFNPLDYWWQFGIRANEFMGVCLLQKIASAVPYCCSKEIGLPSEPEWICIKSSKPKTTHAWKGSKSPWIKIPYLRSE